tara:strand:- start:1007 stop:1291 length:285 start_codon:yes stop_codon:yes gene_type:complete
MGIVPQLSKEFLEQNQMTSYTENVVLFCILVFIAFWQAVISLSDLFRKGIFISKKVQLEELTVKQLRQLTKQRLESGRGLYKLNKSQLVEALLA